MANPSKPFIKAVKKAVKKIKKENITDENKKRILAQEIASPHPACAATLIMITNSYGGWGCDLLDHQLMAIRALAYTQDPSALQYLRTLTQEKITEEQNIMAEGTLRCVAQTRTVPAAKSYLKDALTRRVGIDACGESAGIERTGYQHERRQETLDVICYARSELEKTLQGVIV